MKQFNLSVIMLITILLSFLSCGDDEQAKSTENSITEFTINSVNGTINETDKTINLTLPFGTEVTKLKPTLTISNKASVTPNSGVETDFTNPVKYIVKAENGDVKEYTVTVVVSKNNESKILSFKIGDVDATINEGGKTITAILPKGTNITALKPVISVSAKASVSPASQASQNFTNSVKYTVTAEDGSKSEYTVTITTAKSSEAKITSFVFRTLSPSVTATIDETAKIITASVSYGTNITALNPTVTVSADAAVSPNTVQNFTNSVKYTVTAEDGTKSEYTVQVVVLPFDASITGTSGGYLLAGDSFTISGKFATSGNKVSLKSGSTVVEPTIVSENATTIVAKLPNIVSQGDYTLSVLSNGTTASYSKKLALYPADKPVIFYSDKTAYNRESDKIIVTGRNFKAKTTAVPYLFFTTTANVTTNNIKLMISINEDGTIATRFSIAGLDAVDYTMSIFIDGVESNKVDVKIK